MNNVHVLQDIHIVSCIYKASREHVLSVRPHRVRPLLNAGEVHEVAGSVLLVVDLLRIRESQLVSHVRIVSDSHEIVVPRSLENKLET